MDKVICGYCKKEYQKSSREKMRSPKIGYLCSDCRKINSCGNPFCPPEKENHVH